MSNVSNYESIYGNDEKPHYTENWVVSSYGHLPELWNCTEGLSVQHQSDYCKKVIFNLKNSAHVLHQKSCRRSKKSESHWKWHESVNLELSSLEGEIFATKACQSLTKDFSRVLDWIE